jgi:hypothetical protein
MTLRRRLELAAPAPGQCAGHRDCSPDRRNAAD